MSTKQKIQVLVEATTRGEAVLAGRGDLQTAARELQAAIQQLGGKVGPEWAEELERGLDLAGRLYAELGKQQVNRLDDATVRGIRPCPSCNSTELLLADRCSIDGVILAMIVCPQCGNTRLWCPAPEALRGDRAFRAISVPGGDAGPFR
jgi:hypothetical protein